MSLYVSQFAAYLLTVRPHVIEIIGYLVAIHCHKYVDKIHDIK
jgi:hypothetical protein